MYFLYDKLLLPLRFDDKYYLKAYPEVADEIASGLYRNAIEHYRMVGAAAVFLILGLKPRGLPPRHCQ